MAHLAAHFEPPEARQSTPTGSQSPHPYMVGQGGRTSSSRQQQQQHAFPQMSDSGTLVHSTTSSAGYFANNASLHNTYSSLDQDADIDPQQLATEPEDEDDASTASGRRHGALLVEEVNEWMLQHSFFHWGLKRHITHGNPKPRDERDLPDWRMRERLRTVTAALVMCLNIGVDPPDVSKTNPCSKLICWMDPSSLEVSKALPAIGRNLQAQFETLSTKTRYKQYLDPIVEETRRFCTTLRRAAKDERVLFYYNGYGVPKPTPGGEIWVFNKAYTQYIPVTLYDLLTWLGSPCIFVWDASSAGNVVVNFKRLQERKAEEEAARSSREREGQHRSADRDRSKIGNADASFSSGKKTGAKSSEEEEPHFPLRESIHLAACGPDEVLPMNPDLPADLFTCCLTSPIEISLRWFVLQNPLPSKLNVDMVMNIPGRLQDRRTPLGELNWIFTAITDTIAWTVLPRTIFRRLFRDDLMVAALLRNFLLAERIMRFYHCTPMSHPKLPPTHNHPLWDSWDLAVDQCLAQLPTLLAKERAQAEAAEGGPPVPPHLASFEYRHSTFFSEQLKAFEVWLQQGGVSRKGRRRRVNAAITPHGNPSAGLSSAATGADPEAFDDDGDVSPVREPPDQLPIVLQVLLSQAHRLRALILLSQFLDLGPWAVNMALSIGIFPYVLKLLQSPAADLKPVLIYIWARILAVDRSCQNDLLRDNGFIYFAGVLSPFQNNTVGQNPGANGPSIPIPNVSEHQAMCAFILAVFCQDFPAGQAACLETDVMHSCLEHLEDDDFLLRQWSALCLAQLWDDNEAGKARAISLDAHGKLCCMLGDVSPEVRAAVLHALGTLLGASGSSQDQVDIVSYVNGEPVPASNNSNATRPASARRFCPGTGAATGLPPAKQRGLEIGIATAMLTTKGDCSPLVRKELVIALSPVVSEYKGFFVLAAYLYYSREGCLQTLPSQQDLKSATSRAKAAAAEDRRGSLGSLGRQPSGSSVAGPSAGALAMEEALLARLASKLLIEEEIEEEDIANIPAFTTIFVALLDLSVDSNPEVANLACTVVDFVIALLLESDVSSAGESVLRGFGTAEAITRFTTPTSTDAASEGYFPLTPRSTGTTPGSVDEMSTSQIAAMNGAHVPPSGFGTGGSGPARPGQVVRTQSQAAPKRSSTLAQAVKTLATLGYSRPASPVGSDHDSMGRPLYGEAGPSGIPPPGPAVLAPRRSPATKAAAAQYSSPYLSKGGAGGPTTPSLEPPSTVSMPSSPLNATAKLGNRSQSAESLSYINGRGDRKKSAGSSSGVAAVQGQQYANGNGNGNAHDSSIDHSNGGAHEQQRFYGDEFESDPHVAVDDHVKVGDALAGLIAMDMYRFRSRFTGSADGSSQNTPASSPAVSRANRWGFVPTPGSSGLSTPSGSIGSGGASNELRETLPLKSRLFAWCSEYYIEPQMKQAESEEPGSIKYNVQHWKKQRNSRLTEHSLEIADDAAQSAWSEHGGYIRNGAVPHLMLFHQYENHLVTASDQDTVAVWDWEEKRLLSRFANGNPARTNITSALFINEDSDAMLLVGSAEGNVRIYRHYDSPAHTAGFRGPELASSFQALPDLVRSKRPSGLVVDWLQGSGHLLAGGDSRVIRVWDAHRELCVVDIPTRASSCVTSISSESDFGHLFVAGFGDGTVGVYDRRNPPEASLVRLWEEHQTWVQDVHLQKRGSRELVTASVDGEVRLWDMRVRSSIAKLSLGGKLGGKLSCMAVHERIPLFAVSSAPKPLRPSASPQTVLLTHLETLSALGKPIVRNFAPMGSTQHLGNSTLLYPPEAVNSGVHHHHHHLHHLHHPGETHHLHHHHPASNMGGSGILSHGSTHGHAGASGGSGTHGGPHLNPTNPLHTLLPPAAENQPSSFTPAMGSMAFHPHLPILAFGGPDSVIELREWPDPN
ncbi:related to KOG1 - Subunit of TORC1, a rapamycin-sensitive complex involved in growth control [Ustilago trichophora]|uniref:Related to KOG1 - Subunit of TORC1, a rapamycin-sensitive complex involved in growth control n=1 Tax=Ustilago trichophora TaxID=86804 RepID=A0A5C3DQT4_9BASI|nr:related to KOG1 - Subunit of TORC1, a rapamycin-sensitive complex involved in growth control [Ustilago trichophora]